MRTLKAIAFAVSVVLALTALPATAPAGQQVGAMVGLKGKATLQRGGDSREAKLKDPIELKDFVETAKQSRAKMLFIDESILTLGPESKASIEKFVYSKEGGGASIFNLLDGKMRSIVGKTAFEVHTPTSVAAARGTVIDFLVGTEGGRPFTVITCLRGSVEVRSIDPAIMGVVTLAPGQMVKVLGGEELPAPAVAPRVGPRAAAKAAAEEDGGGEVEGGDSEKLEDARSSLDNVAADRGVESPVQTETILLPPVELESETGKTSPVKINVQFPQR